MLVHEYPSEFRRIWPHRGAPAKGDMANNLAKM